MKKMVLVLIAAAAAVGYARFRQVPVSAAPGGGSPELNIDPT